MIPEGGARRLGLAQTIAWGLHAARSWTFAACILLSMQLHPAATAAQDRGSPPRLVFEHALYPGNPATPAFLHDRWGFLWFGTEGGLFRYDGYGARRFAAGPDGLSNAAVYALAEDLTDPLVLWVGTLGGGLDRLDTRTGTRGSSRDMRTIPGTPAASPPRSPQVRCRPPRRLLGKPEAHDRPAIHRALRARPHERRS